MTPDGQPEQTCRICKQVFHVTEFIRPTDKWKNRRKSCNDCAAKDAARKVTQEKLHCSSCNQKKPRDLFFDDQGRRRATCSDCRGKGKRAKYRKPYEGRVINGYPGWSGLHFDDVNPLDPQVYPFTNIERVASASAAWLGIDTPLVGRVGA